MSTNALVAVKEGDSNTGIYVHWDGYPEALGKTLIEHYNTEVKVRGLISKGDALTIASTIPESEFYIDRGGDWKGIKPRTFANVMDKIKNATYEYVYIFYPSVMKWDCYHVYGDDWLYNVVEHNIGRDTKTVKGNKMIKQYKTEEAGQPLTDVKMSELIEEYIGQDKPDLVDIEMFARAIEKAHGIGEEI